MYRILFKYLVNPSKKWISFKNLGLKDFNTKQEAYEWTIIQSKLGNIKPLRLLLWDELIQCYSVIKEFN